MQAMKNEKDQICDKIDTLEAANKALDIRLDKTLEEATGLARKIVTLENDFEVAKDALLQTNTKLEEREVSFNNAESEVNNLNRRVNALEEDYEKSEERLVVANGKNHAASQAADDANRMKKVLENRNMQDAERMDSLESQLKEARFLAEEADRKYDDVAKKLSEVEAMLERAEDRAETGENKVFELEDELTVVGNNLKSMGNAEEQAQALEVQYKETVHGLQKKLKIVEARADYAERNVKKLQKDIDTLEDELGLEKQRFKGISDELDETFNEISGY